MKLFYLILERRLFLFQACGIFIKFLKKKIVIEIEFDFIFVGT